MNTLLHDWPDLSQEERLEAFESVPREQAQKFFLELSSHDQLDLLMGLRAGERLLWLRLLPPDDAADVIQLAPQEEKQELMAQLDDVSRREVNALLAYKEDAAGGLMNPRFARVRPDMTADEAISYLRRQSTEIENFYYAYALDDSQRLLGVVGFRDLFSSDRSRTVAEMMRTNVISVRENTDQEAVAALFKAHRLLAIPVVDETDRMQGVITLDDIVDVLQDEASEDIQKFGGMEALDAPYFKISFSEMVRKRAGWLSILFLGEMLTATAMGHFQEEIERAVVLALFVPLIISSGGNSGSQATTLVIRAMALGEVRLRDWWRIIMREFSTGFALGVVLAVIGLTRIVVWQALWHSYGPHYVLIGLTVAFSLIGVVLFGTMAGSMLPFVLKRAGLDPASASAPFVATLVDVSGLIIYFTIARVIMRGLMGAA